VAALLIANIGRAQTLGYSFEVDEEGFAPNGGVFPITQDTIGATHGTHSLKVSVPSGATFVGALTTFFPTTEIGDPIIGDPPGIDYVLFDLTITEQFGPPPPTPRGFAVVGITMFGHGGGQFGLNPQFADTESIDDKAPGTYRDVRIDLASATHPLTFELEQSFNEIFCSDVVCGENDLLPSGFQFFLNKTGSASSHPLTVYIDNVRFVPPPAALPGDYNSNGAVDAADYVLWRDGGPLMNEVADPGSVSAVDYTEWRARFGTTPAPGQAFGSAAVPEPASLLLIAAAVPCLNRNTRRRSQ
jgi:hypothetical protein